MTALYFLPLTEFLETPTVVDFLHGILKAAQP
jgi:hypothetical protein